MHAQSQELRRYMAETTVPVVQRVKEVHDAMEDEGRSVQFSRAAHSKFTHIERRPLYACSSSRI